MARPLVKGAPVTFRLSLVADAALRARAAAAGVTPGRYLAARLEAQLNPVPGAATVRPAVPGGSNTRTMIKEPKERRPVPKEAETGCDHKERVPIAGGLMRCAGCGAIRGADRAWRG